MRHNILTEEQALEIYRRTQTKESKHVIAADFGVSRQTVQEIKTGRNWGYVTGLRKSPTLEELADGEEVREVPGYEGLFITRKGVVIHHWHGRFRVIAQRYEREYAKITVSNYTLYVHRLLCLVFKYDTYFEGAVARHLDDNRLNIDLDNLVWGTQQENMDDKERNGHQLHGTSIPWAALNESQVLQILDLIQKGDLTYKQIAKKFGVSATTVRHISIGKSWGWLTEGGAK